MPQQPRERAGAVVPRRTQIIGLDLLRVIAALLVMLFHYCWWGWTQVQPERSPPATFLWFSPLASRGWVGVQIFFVISGFVIAYSMEGMTAARFAWHRLERLLPAALLCASVTAAALLLFTPEHGIARRWLDSVTFWPGGPWVDGSYWTLPVEISFYTIMCVVLTVRRGHYLSVVMLVLGMASACADLALLWRPTFLSDASLRTLGRCWFPPMACLLPVYGAFFALGAFLFLCLTKGLTWFRVAGAAVCLVGCVAEILWHDRGLIFAIVPRKGGWGSVLVWSVAVLLLVLSVVGNAQLLQHLGPRALRWTRLAGLSTYPFYLLHAQLGEGLVRVLAARIPAPMALCAVFAAIAALAVVIAKYLEPRLRGILKSVDRSRHTRELMAG